MIYFPETIIQWSTMLWRIFTLLLIDARWHLLCAWSFLEAVMGSSSLLPDILLCLLASPVRTQPPLTGPHWGPWPPRPQSGVPTPRVHAHSLSRVQNTTYYEYLYLCMDINYMYILYMCSSSVCANSCTTLVDLFFLTVYIDRGCRGSLFN
jgi:hypothetical protein